MGVARKGPADIKTLIHSGIYFSKNEIEARCTVPTVTLLVLGNVRNIVGSKVQGNFYKLQQKVEFNSWLGNRQTIERTPLIKILMYLSL